MPTVDFAAPTIELPIAVTGMVDALTKQVGLRPHATALIYNDHTITYAELYRRVSTVSAQLSVLGIKPGDKVGVLFPNHPSIVASFFGILNIGAVIVPVNPLLKSDEIAHILSDSNAKALIVHSSVTGEVGAALEQVTDLEHIIIKFESGNTHEQLTQAKKSLGAGALINIAALADETEFARSQPLPEHKGTADNTALIIYTSGTTGKPKGAVFTHANLMYVLPDRLFDSFGITSKDVCLGILPFCHMFGLGVSIYGIVARGASLVILPKFEAKTTLQAIEKHGVTILAAVPAMYQFMLMALDEEMYKVDAVRLCFSSGSAMSPELLEQLESRFGAVIAEGYALTETACGATVNRSGLRQPGSVGTALAGIQVAIKDTDGTKLPSGKEYIGEIAIKGPHIMSGYHNNPEATAETIKDGWFHSGDLGYRDHDGRFYIVGRKKELIIRGGQNVYPAEVERVIMQLPGIQEAAVIGVPDPLMGERIKAVVVPQTGFVFSEDDVKEHCSHFLAPYKVPRIVEFSTGLPRNSTGKVLKRLLK